MKRTTLRKLTDAKAKGRAMVLATRLDTGEEQLVDPWGQGSGELHEAAKHAAQRDQSAPVTADGHEWFLNVFNPQPKLFIVGAVHIAQPLSRMAALSNFAVTVIDPRTAFATAERFPGLTLSTEWPDEALGKVTLDARSAVVTLTHDPKLDDPALIAALRAPVFYIGALGSRKTHTSRLGRLKAAGFYEDALARIHGPVGMDIGAVSPAEIAVSIMAQIVATLRADV